MHGFVNMQGFVDYAGFDFVIRPGDLFVEVSHDCSGVWEWAKVLAGPISILSIK